MDHVPWTLCEGAETVIQYQKNIRMKSCSNVSRAQRWWQVRPRYSQVWYLAISDVIWTWSLQLPHTICVSYVCGIFGCHSCLIFVWHICIIFVCLPLSSQRRPSPSFPNSFPAQPPAWLLGKVWYLFLPYLLAPWDLMFCLSVLTF